MRLHPIDIAQIVGMRYFLTNLGLLASLVYVLETSDRTDAVNYLKFGKMATEVMEGMPQKYQTPKSVFNYLILALFLRSRDKHSPDF